MNSLIKISALLFSVIALFSSCKKSDFLNANPNQANVIPSTLKDCEAILDNIGVMNGYGNGLIPGLVQIGSDDQYVVPELFVNGSLPLKLHEDVYIWSDDIYSDINYFPNDWGVGYRCVFYANSVLELLKKLTPNAEEQIDYDRLKVSALFYRAHAFWWLLQAYSPPYDETTSATDLGIPLKMSADINEKLTRASVKECYEKVIADLIESMDGLPEIPPYVSRPSKLAVYGLLARIYLSMRDYDKTLINAEAYLAIKNNLLDYNNVASSTATFPMPDPRVNNANPEIAFYAVVGMGPGMETIYDYCSRIDSNLYNTYHQDDLRKYVFFEEAFPYFGIPGDVGYFFKGSYIPTGTYFAGIATDEIYLTRAECYARKSDVIKSMQDLNSLLRKRWKNTATYNDIVAANATDALSKIILERRKELLFRGLRWVDLRRLNKEGANINVSRDYKGQTYTLSPNSLKYAWVLPNDVLAFNPGMQQNPR